MQIIYLDSNNESKKTTHISHISDSHNYVQFLYQFNLVQLASLLIQSSWAASSFGKYGNNYCFSFY